LKNKNSLLSQIQNVIAKEALSIKSYEVYLDTNDIIPILRTFQSNKTNPNCMCFPEKVDKYIKAPNHIIKQLSQYALAQTAQNYIVKSITNPYINN
jgi:hypothetical protein